MDSCTLFVCWVAVIGFGLVVLATIQLARSNGEPPITPKEEERRARLPLLILALLFWAFITFCMLTSGGGESIRMPWG